MRKSSKRVARSSSPALFQSLEARQFLSATTIGIYADKNASETNPTTSGRGVFIFKRPTGSTLHSISLGYFVRSTSTTTTADYQTLPGVVTIPAGKRSVAINVFPVDDSAVEGTEKLDLSLRPRSDAATVHAWGEITIADNDTATSGWLGGSRTDRATFTYNPGSTARSAQPFDYNINFSSVLSGLNKSGSLIDDSIQVVEVDSSGNSINSAVPYQFDHATSGYNASSNASGDLVVEATGNTAANATRHYQVYFDTTGSYTAPSFTSLVTTTDNVNDASSVNSIKLQTTTATYYYEKPYGALSDIFDTQNNDWVSWNPTTNNPDGSAGEFRGTPNLGPVGFHPGRSPTLSDGTTADTMTTTIVSSGPLKTVVDSKASTTGNEVKWEVYPTYAKMTVISMDRAYWFLYEATPGGSGPNSNDNLVGSDGNTPVSTNGSTLSATYSNHDDSNTNLNHSGEEWAYIDDTAINSGAGRSFFAVHDNADSAVDSYYNLENNMTVLGFGRDNSGGASTPVLTGSNTFTIGLTDGGSDFASTSAYIKGAYKDVTLAAGTSSVKS